MKCPVSLTTGPTPAFSVPDGLELLGRIVRLQVQTASLKRGERPRRWYDPAFIRPVPRLRLDEGGATGWDRITLPDVHHRDHPQSKFRGENGLSIGFTGHYDRLRSRFGSHLTDGVAGENILVDATRVFAEDEVSGGIVVVGTDGPVAMTAVQQATPCVEFSKFCAGYAVDQRADTVITETLQFLHQGMRGFYATLADGSPSPVTIALGDLVYRRLR